MLKRLFILALQSDNKLNPLALWILVFSHITESGCSRFSLSAVGSAYRLEDGPAAAMLEESTYDARPWVHRGRNAYHTLENQLGWTILGY